MFSKSVFPVFVSLNFKWSSENTTGKELAEVTGPTLAKGGFPVLYSQHLPMVQKSNHWQSIYFIKMLLVCLKNLQSEGHEFDLWPRHILFCEFCLYFLMFFIHKMYFFVSGKALLRPTFFSNVSKRFPANRMPVLANLFNHWLPSGHHSLKLIRQNNDTSC